MAHYTRLLTLSYRRESRADMFPATSRSYRWWRRHAFAARKEAYEVSGAPGPYCGAAIISPDGRVFRVEYGDHYATCRMVCEVEGIPERFDEESHDNRL
jgi:hypothetical protein